MIVSEKHPLTLHSRVMASGGTPPEIWLEIVAAISCLHHSTWDPVGLCEKKQLTYNTLKQVLQSMYLMMWDYRLHTGSQMLVLMCSADILWSYYRLKMTDGDMRSEKCAIQSDLSSLKNETTYCTTSIQALKIYIFLSVLVNVSLLGTKSNNLKTTRRCILFQMDRKHSQF